MKRIIMAMCLLAGVSLPTLAQKKPMPKAKTPAAKAVVPAASLAAGKALYAQNCLACHQADGAGVERMNAPLTKTSWVLGDKTRLVKVLLNGMQGVDIDDEVYTNVMPAFAQLSDQQLADVLTYIRNSFGNKATAVSSAEVKAVRATNKK